MGITPPSFFKVLIGDFQNKLFLPKAFIIKYFDDDNVPINFILRSSTSRSWTVSVKQFDEGVFLCKEWRNFVSHHTLELGDILIFRYNGNSEFIYKIFGKDTCEKEERFAKNLDENDSHCAEQEPRRKQPGVACFMQSLQLHLLQNIPSAKLICVAASNIMRIIYLQNIPTSFARKYLKDAPKDRDVTLRTSHGGPWHARYAVRTFQKGVHHYKLIMGWKAFALDNHLKTGDDCIFELVDRNQIEFKVSIVRH
ncbi:hypothetical protein IFM89_015363 [Coptis chinensis]|uniref:TF-B3 domain-containing protein n=1 Tax=Coptis chinensis TaxID=261450 RepID=A0A835IA81_9MAGN|nr:hypothetical protein IFM89_015363 [Coptis chinensis]